MAIIEENPLFCSFLKTHKFDLGYPRIHHYSCPPKLYVNQFSKMRRRGSLVKNDFFKIHSRQFCFLKFKFIVVNIWYYTTLMHHKHFGIFLWNKMLCPHCFDKKRIVGKKNFFWPAKNLKLGSVWLKNRFYFNTNSNIWCLRLCVSRPFSLFFSSLIILMFVTTLELL